MHENTSNQPSEIPSISKKTSSLSESTNNTSLSSSSDQSNNNATLNQILSCLTNIKQDIKTLKYDVHNFKQEQSKLIHRMGNIELEIESFRSPSYELNDEMKDYLDAESQSKSHQSNNYDEISPDDKANDRSQYQAIITL